MKKILSITLCLMLLLSTLALTASAALTYTEYTWHDPIRITAANNFKDSGADYILGAPGEAVSTAATVGYSANALLGPSYENLYMNLDISGYNANEISTARVMFWTNDNTPALYSLPASDWSTTTVPTLTNATAIELVNCEEDAPSDYTTAPSGAATYLRNYDITAAVKGAIENEQSSVIIVLSFANSGRIYGLKNITSRPGIQIKTAVEKEVESTTKSTVKTAWAEPVRISTKASAYYSGNEYIFGTPGSAVDTTTTLGYSGNFKLTNAGNHLYMKMDISGYTADEISAARVMFWTDNTSVNLYSLPDTAWNTTTAPLLTNATAIELADGASDIPDDYNFTHDTRRLKNYDITSAVKAAKTAGQTEFVLVIEAKSTTYLYYLQASAARPGMQIQKSASVDTAATFTGTLAAGSALDLTYAIDNGWASDLSVDCIVAIYENGTNTLKYVGFDTITVTSSDSAGDTYTYTIPADAGDLTNCTAKAYIWTSDLIPISMVLPLAEAN